MRTATLVVALCLSAAACGKDSPTGPSVPTGGSKSIALGGNLQFGPVPLNTTATGLLVITNTGAGTVTISNIVLPCGPMYQASWQRGDIPQGQTQNITLTFRPTAMQNCTGTIQVTADQVSGTPSIPIRASGQYTNSGTGNTVFDLPTYIRRIAISGRFDGSCCSNFIVQIGSSLVVNVIIGPAENSRVSEGTYLTTGGVVSITHSDGVRWAFTELQ